MIPTKISSPGTQRQIVALRVVLAVLAIGFVASQVDATAIFEAARNADPLWIAFAVFLLPINVVLEALTWRPILRRVVSEVRFSETLVSVLSGYPIGFLTPARVGDFAGRALSINRGDRTQIGLSAAVSRLPDLAAILLAGTAVLVAMNAAGTRLFQGDNILLAFSATALLIVIIVIFMPSVIQRVVARLPVVKKIESRLSFLAELPARVMGGVLVLAIVRYAVYCFQFVLLAFAFAPEIQPLPLVAAVALTFLTKSIVPPLTFLDLGVREGAAAFFFGLFGIGSVVGFSSALMLFVVNLVLPAIIAIPLIARFRVSSRGSALTVAASQLRT